MGWAAGCKFARWSPRITLGVIQTSTMLICRTSPTKADMRAPCRRNVTCADRDTVGNGRSALRAPRPRLGLIGDHCQPRFFHSSKSTFSTCGVGITLLTAGTTGPSQPDRPPDSCPALWQTPGSPDPRA